MFFTEILSKPSAAELLYVSEGGFNTIQSSHFHTLEFKELSIRYWDMLWRCQKTYFIREEIDEVKVPIQKHNLFEDVKEPFP